MIKSVMGLKIGHYFIYDRAIWEVISFPTRYTVRGKIVKNTSPIMCSTYIIKPISSIYFNNIWNSVLFGEI